MIEQIIQEHVRGASFEVIPLLLSGMSSDRSKLKPYFVQTESQMTVQEGDNAFFNCKVANLYNETVSEKCKGKATSHYTYVWWKSILL